MNYEKRENERVSAENNVTKKSVYTSLKCLDGIQKRIKLKVVLIFILVFQIVFGIGITQQSYATTNELVGPEALIHQIADEGALAPAMLSATSELEKLAVRIENSTEKDLPQNIPNAFYLANQTLTTAGRTYDLSRFNLVLPSIPINNFDEEVQIEINRNQKTLNFVRKNDDNELARQTIANIDVVAYARDKELLQFISSDGKIHAIDMVFARQRDLIFKTPLPVFTVGEIPAEFNSQIENISAAFLTRGFRPPELVNENAVVPITDKSLFNKNSKDSFASIKADGQWAASPFILYKDMGAKRELLGIYHRDVTQSQIQTGFGILHFLAYVISPDGQADVVVDQFANSTVVNKASQIERLIDPVTREAISAFKPEIINQLSSRVQIISANKDNPTDKFLYSEWLTSFRELHAKATAGSSSEKMKLAAHSGDLGEYWQTLVKKQDENELQTEKKMFKRLVSGRGLKYIAAITAGYAALVSAHLYGGSLIAGNGPAWAVDVANTIYDIMPAVLKDAEYRVTMFKGVHALSSLLLINYIAGVLVGKAKGWDFKKALATMGIRTAAFLQFSFIARLAQLTRQKSFVTALRSGSNPFSKVAADSTEGQMAGITESIRPGLNNPFLRGEDLHNRSVINQRVLEAKLKIKQRRKAMAAILANLVVAEKFGIDPATLYMAEKGALDGERLDKLNAEIQQLKANPIIFKQWKTLAREIYFTINDVTKFKEDVSQVSKVDFISYYKIAKATAEKMTRRSRFKEIATQLRLAWVDLTQEKISKSVGDFGYSQYEFLKNVDPTAFISKQSWEQFVLDFMPTLIQVPLVGPRADIIGAQTDSHIRLELAHGENYFAWSTPGHRSDMFNQYAIYGVAVPARMAQVYGDMATQVTETRYQPIERITHEGVKNPEGFLGGLWSWIKGASNLSEAGYGYLFTKDFLKRIKAMQLSFIMDFTCRVLIAKQAVSAALPAFAYSVLMAEWLYAWAWKPITRGNQIYQDRVDANNEIFFAAKIKIAQGLRVNDENLWREGFKSLSQIWLENTKLDRVLSESLNEIFSVLNESQEVLVKREAAIKERVEPFIGSVIRLKIALESRDKEKILIARNELISRYSNSELLSYEKLDAQTLLEYSLLHPPIYNETNSKVSSTLNFAGSLITTYLGTLMFVDTLRLHSWPEKIWGAALISVPLYVSLFYGQKTYNNYVKTNEYIRLREELPKQAFALAEAKKPQFKTLTEYAVWLKNNPTSSQLIREAELNDIVMVLTNGKTVTKLTESQVLQQINRLHRPSLQEIKSCALIMSSGEPAPMRLFEKIRTRIRGVVRPPAN